MSPSPRSISPIGEHAEKARSQAEKTIQKAKDVVVCHRDILHLLTTEDDEVMLNDAKLEAAEATDGLHGILASLLVDGLSTDLAFEHHHDLRQVEAACRVTRRDL